MEFLVKWIFYRLMYIFVPFELGKIVNSDFWRGTMERKEFLVKWIFYRLMYIRPPFELELDYEKL